MEIKTERLILHPLTPDELHLWAEDMPALEKKLNVSYRAEPMEGFFLDIVRGQADITDGDPENYIWHTFWLIIRESDRVAVGSADFKDVPDGKGETEIGYGLGAEFEHNGYMTETVSAMCAWAKDQPGVRAVIAETETDNLQSQRILIRCGFEEYDRGETLWWRKTF